MFLKLRLRSTGEDVVVNMNQVRYLYPEQGGVTTIKLSGEHDRYLEVKETPAASWKMIEAAERKR